MSKAHWFLYSTIKTKSMSLTTSPHCMNISADGVFLNLQANCSDFTVNRSPKVYLEPLKSYILQQIQLLRRMSRIYPTKSKIVWILCSNPLKSEFDRFAVLMVHVPEASTSGQAASFYTVNRL